ncbi:hypothetical protein A0J61_00477 [Choanephora cucurbitarum]|uniref:Uncharacterized protein n=1 Tax=Choanephora cucurbitarum TaxID=101091 RepID=A0A1C7NR24_9FUNG|nr:hypothetical protein A0J61_00477 [Choanephora cucurbitarum]
MQNFENLDRLMKQSNQIGELKEELETIKKDTEAHYEDLLAEKDQLIYQSQQRIEELENRKQQESIVESLSVQEDKHLDIKTVNELQRQLEEKDKFIYQQKAEFDELKAQWEVERAELVRPALEQVTEQLDELKRTNKVVVERLNEKEDELAELRAELSRKDREPIKSTSAFNEREKRLNRLTIDLENDRLLAQKLEDLNQQLEAQKQKHEAILKTHAQVIAEKDKVLLQHQKSLDQLKRGHENATKSLEEEQRRNIQKLEIKHQHDIEALTKRLKQAESQAKNHINDELDQLLVEFEQSQHNHTVELADLQKSHQEQLSVMKRGQQEEIASLMNQGKVNNFFKAQGSASSIPTSPRSASKLKDNTKFSWPPVTA